MLDPFQDTRSREYPDAGASIFLNAASYGLLPLSSARAASDLLLSRNRADGFNVRDWPRALRRCRRAAASLIGAPVESVALAQNTSFGVNLAAHLVGQGPPGVVVLSQGEFPANVFPWLELDSRGFRVEIVPTTADGMVDEVRLLEAASGPEVRALAVSAVQFHTGYRADLAALGRFCRDRELFFAVDGIQALGLDGLYPAELGIDVLATGGQKWLCSPWGSGFVYLSERALRDATPQVVSWLSYASTQKLEGLLSYDREFLPDARRFEFRTVGVQDFLGHAVSLELLGELGPERIREYIHGLHEPVIQWLDGIPEGRLVTPRALDRRGGILAFRLDGGGDTDRQSRAMKALTSAGITAVVREGYLRLAPHFYNTPEQMERVVDVLDGSLA